jgi:hypothetical protein
MDMNQTLIEFEREVLDNMPESFEKIAILAAVKHGHARIKEKAEA